jgi:hypothetical protein
VVETLSYLARAEKLLTVEERDQVLEMLARDPECGDILKGTGGVRKVRFAMEGRGQSGGARVVYFFYNEKANLSAAERNQLAKLVGALKKQLRKGAKSDA